LTRNQGLLGLGVEPAWFDELPREVPLQEGDIIYWDANASGFPAHWIFPSEQEIGVPCATFVARRPKPEHKDAVLRALEIWKSRWHRP